MYFSYVRSRFEYGALIWYPIYQCHVDNIESPQRRFLKYLSFKEDGTYPPRGIDNNLLLDRFQLPSLELRRAIVSIKFLYNLLHNNIDCSFLLNKLSFFVPRLAGRNNYTFICDTPRRNYLVRSPVFIISNNFNKICQLCDIHQNSLNQIVNVASLNF